MLSAFFASSFIFAVRLPRKEEEEREGQKV